MRALKPLPAIAVVISLSACATTGGGAERQATLFTRNDTSPQQQVFTDQKCWVEADRGNFAPQVVAATVTSGLVGGLAGAFTAGLLEGTRKVNAHARCMTQEGYTPVTVSAEQAKAYRAAKSLDEKAAVLGANSYSTGRPGAQPTPGLARTISRF